MARTTTPRGFHDYDSFRDTYGSEVTVRESSNASGPHVWVFCKENPQMVDPSPHLNVEQARRVIAALQAFVDEAPERWGLDSEDGIEDNV